MTISTELRDLAASLAIEGSVLGGPSAARRWRMPVDDSRTCVYVGRPANVRFPGVTAWYSSPGPDDVLRVDGALVTGRARTVVDCALLLPERQAIELLDLALVRGWLSLPTLTEQIGDRVGRRGVRRLVRLMRLLADGTQSAAERLAADLFRRNNVIGWRANAPVRDGHGLIGLGDFVFEEARLVVEIDGIAFHSDPTAFRSDRERQNRILSAGWRLLRFTWYDLRYRPQHVIDHVSAELAKA
jgi:very-short-patch-repair endonuclease